MSRQRKTDKHLPPCVYLRHGAYYYVKAGRPWERLGTSLAEALEKYSQRIEAPTGGMVALIDDALAAMKSKGLAESSLRQYKVAGERLKKTFVAFTPQQVLPRHIAKFKQSMAHKPNQANRCLSVLRLVFDYALEMQLVDTNPAVSIKRHREAKRTRLITLEEYERLYSMADPRMQIIMELLRYLGQRIQDTLNIREEDILDEGVRFRQQKTGTYVTIKWKTGSREAVARARAMQGKVRTMHLLRGRRLRPPDYSTVQRQWVELCERAGVPDAHIHDVRAVAATEARRQGLNATDLLGHKNAKQTETYLRDREAKVVDGPDYGRVQKDGVGQKG